MSSKLGWNIEGNDLNTRRNQIINELKSYRANWHLCLGDEALAVDLLKHTAKGVIYRVFDPFNEYRGGADKTFDAEIWQRHAPAEIVLYVQTKLSHLIHHDKLWFSIGNNEPSTRGKTQAFVKWCVELMDLGALAGIKFAVAEIASAKSIDHNEVKSGVWDNFIDTLDQYRGTSTPHIATFHEYTTGILPATLLPDYPLNLANPDALQTANWENAVMNLASIDGNYHLGRGALVTHVRAKQLGIAPLPFVITECAFDWMDDIATGERGNVINPLRAANKPSTPHDSLRGSTGHEPYHHWLMGKTGFQGDWNDWLFAQYEWLVSAYPPECEGFTIFALNHDWDIPEGHDMSKPRNDKFRQLVIQTPLPRSQEEPQPMPETWNPTLYDATVRSVADNIRVREGMSTNTAIKASITQTPVAMKVSKETNPANGYEWYKSDLGYFADLDILRIEYADVPTDEPDTGNETPSDLEAFVKQLEAKVQADEARISALEARIEDLLTLVQVDIPIPNFTMSVPKFMVESVATEHDGKSNLHHAIASRLRSGTPTLSQIANEIYSTATAVPEDIDFSNVALGIGNEELLENMERTITDVIMNEDTDDDEQLAS